MSASAGASNSYDWAVYRVETRNPCTCSGSPTNATRIPDSNQCVLGSSFVSGVGNVRTAFQNKLISPSPSPSPQPQVVQANACLGNPNLPILGSRVCSSGPDYCSTLQADPNRPNTCQVFVTGTKNGDVSSERCRQHSVFSFFNLLLSISSIYPCLHFSPLYFSDLSHFPHLYFKFCGFVSATSDSFTWTVYQVNTGNPCTCSGSPFDFSSIPDSYECIRGITFVYGIGNVDWAVQNKLVSPSPSPSTAAPSPLKADPAPVALSAVAMVFSFLSLALTIYFKFTQPAPPVLRDWQKSTQQDLWPTQTAQGPHNQWAASGQVSNPILVQ